MPLVPQNLIFDKPVWTPNLARSWMKKHGYKPIKRVHATLDSLRYRLVDPELFAPDSFKTVKIGKSIKSVMGVYKNYMSH